MKETYHVGFDPEMKLWAAQKITHNFDKKMMVFRVTARNDHDAVSQGMNQFRSMMKEPSSEQVKLMTHINNQVKKLSRQHEDVMIIEVPAALVETAREMESRGFFKTVYEDEIMLDLNSAGWKCMSEVARKEKRDRVRKQAGEYSFS